MGSETSGTSLPDIKAALAFATSVFKGHFFFLLGAFYLSGTVGHLISIFFSEWLRPFLGIAYSSFFTGGLIGICLSFCDGGEPKFSLLVSKINQFWKFLAAHALVFLAYGLGFVLFIIPGLILIVRLSFYAPAIAERDLGPIAAIKYSWQITSGRFWRLVLFNLVIIAILFAPAIIAGFLIGLFSSVISSITHIRATAVSEPVTGLALPILIMWWQLAVVHCYRQLSPAYQSGATPVPREA